MNVGDVTFIHISDSHIGPTDDYERHGLTALPCAERLVETINGLDPAPAFVLHTGDVVTAPCDRSYARAQRVFGRLIPPVYYAVGNHDTAADLKRFMTVGPHAPLLPDGDVWSYAFEMNGHRFLAVDARGPDAIDPRGALSAAQWTVIDRELVAEGPPLTVFTHFPLLPIGSPWIDRTMLIDDGAALHARLAAVAHRIRGVFFGHIHQSVHTMVDGVLYSAAPSTFAQLTGWPKDETARGDPSAPPGYAVVRVTRTGTTVRTLSFPRP